jgi:hypothetical protein
MGIFRRSRVRPLAVLATSALAAGALACLGIGPAPAGARGAQTPLGINWYVDADTLHISNAQEDSWYEDGDEPLVSIVAFRTRPGVRGTTQVWKLSGFSRVCSGADQGRTCGIPDNVGRASFGPVASGEVVGTIQVTIEEDWTPTSSLNSGLDRAVNMIRPELTALSESITPADLLNPTALRGRLQGLVSRVTESTNSDLSWWEELFQDVFGSDSVDIWVTLLPEAGGPQGREAMNWILLGAFYQPDSIVASAALERRNWVLPHRTTGTHWDVGTNVYCTAAIGLGTDPTVCR